MMKATPATPPGRIINGRGRQQATGTHRQRGPTATRFGDGLPYRDDPNAPPSVRLESFTRGGLGPTPLHHNGNGIQLNGNTNTTAENNKAKKNISFSRRCWNSVDGCVRKCCRCSTSSGRRGGDDEYYYEDHFNDLSWSCSIGTSDEDGIWLNQSDPAGTIMSILVWILILYSMLTVSFLAKTNGIPPFLSMAYTVLSSLALACHVKTTLTDPGSVPPSAVPTEQQRLSQTKLSMCSQCQTFKPPLSHHCRICNRCISRMDHHCPWMNNCIGAGNIKHFLLFLMYTWTCSVFLLVLLGWNYFFCAEETCVFNVVLTQLVRIMTVLSVGSFLFTSSMLMNVVYGLMTGIGTIDRLKKKATGTIFDSDEAPVPLTHVFGIGPIYEWPFPVDPVFPDYDQVMGFSTPQRLLREQLMRDGGSVVAGGGGSLVTAGGASTVVSSKYGDSFGMHL